VSAKKWLLSLSAAVLLSTPASAAFLVIDDSNLTTITISAGDFEGGFSLNGVQKTIGLGNSFTETLPDAGYTIQGTWIDLGQASGRVDLLFAFPSAPFNVTSGVEFGMRSDGSKGTLNGSFGGLTGTTYFPATVPTFPQDGSSASGTPPFLSVQFTSESAVPEPSSFLLALPAALLFFRRRK
jgi:hypothetical protein